MGRRRERDDHHDHGFREWGPPPHVRRMMARGGFGPGWGGGPRARRGDVRTGVLQVLSEEPMHGYDVIRALEERSGGRWRPSPGSVYPTLQMLEDAGLVKSEGKDGRRVFEITDAGREELASRQDGREPWEDGGEDPFHELKGSAFQLGAAAMQVARTGSSDQIARAKEILDEARKKIYGILAEA
ncbi:MAG: helix-turn-helix transcriptional regulator [Actinobacteria bacterium]|nr:MAG: helix-turn-helix transcriptional regulator [Actinomycetota bacterium]